MKDQSIIVDPVFYDGGCTCGGARYRMSSAPMYVHCCHCRWCQRESGGAFVLNALIETDRVGLLEGDVERTDTPSNSGKGQVISRCPGCHVALWSNYAYGKIGEAVRFVRVGTLDEPERIPPDIHIFTSTKLPWVVLPPNVPAVKNYYDVAKMWPRDSLARRTALSEPKV